jgi:hypothetical protein
MTRASARKTATRIDAWTAVQWLPALTAGAYAATAAAMGSRIAGELGWDTDTSAPLVLAEKLRGSGRVYLPHIATWTSLWFELATRDLPGHRELWQATPYFFAILGAALVGWATGRLVGRWAGVTAFATALIVGPLALRALFTMSFHVTTPFSAAVLGAFLVLIGRPRATVVAVPVGILAGLNAASDPLLWPAGIVPFAVATGTLWWTSRTRRVALQGGLVVALSGAAALTTEALMHVLGYREIGAGLQLSTIRALPGHLVLLGRLTALLGGANYAIPGPYPSEPLRGVVAILVLLGSITAVISGVKYARRRSEPLTRAYAFYWGTAVVMLGIVFVATSNAASLGAGSFDYLLTLAPAAGAGVALLSFSSSRARVFVAGAVALVGAVNIAGVVEGRAGTPSATIGRYEQPLVRLLVDKGVTHGYAGYWDAQNLSWQSGMRLFVAPVARCGEQDKPLCPLRFSVIASWYRERPGPSFLIVDRTTAFVTSPPLIVSRATYSHRFGQLRVYIFPYDLARNIGAG